MTHHCHARGCTTRCPPEHLMCGRHWRKVPRRIQRLVWAHYRPGQCDDKRPSAEWHEAADAAIAAVAVKEGCPLGKLTIKQVAALRKHAPDLAPLAEEAEKQTTLPGFEDP